MKCTLAFSFLSCGVFIVVTIVSLLKVSIFVSGAS